MLPFPTHPRVHRQPLAVPTFDREDRVLVVGTGLEAVDVLLALHARGHAGRTLAVSPSGAWPDRRRVLAGAFEVLDQLRDGLVLVDRAAEILDLRVFSAAFVVRLRLTGADVPFRAGRAEIWTFERVIVADRGPGWLRAPYTLHSEVAWEGGSTRSSETCTGASTCSSASRTRSRATPPAKATTR